MYIVQWTSAHDTHKYGEQLAIAVHLTIWYLLFGQHSNLFVSKTQFYFVSFPNRTKLKEFRIFWICFFFSFLVGILISNHGPILHWLDLAQNQNTSHPKAHRTLFYVVQWRDFSLFSSYFVKWDYGFKQN